MSPGLQGSTKEACTGGTGSGKQQLLPQYSAAQGLETDACTVKGGSCRQAGKLHKAAEDEAAAAAGADDVGTASNTQQGGGKRKALAAPPFPGAKKAEEAAAEPCTAAQPPPDLPELDSDSDSSAGTSSSASEGSPLLFVKSNLERLGSRAECGFAGDSCSGCHDCGRSSGSGSGSAEPSGCGCTSTGTGTATGSTAVGFTLPAALLLVVLGVLLTFVYYPE